MRKAALHNLGCKVNAYETEAMQEILEKNGYEIVSFQEAADVYIINTCSVTNMADRKSRQMIHRARRQNPQAVIVAAGCYVQALTDAGEKDGNIDIVIGNNKKKELAEILAAYFEGRKENSSVPAPQVAEVIDINDTKEYEELSLTKTAEHTRAYLKVQDGCNQFCTYCIIPYARGRVRSRRREEVVQEVQILAANGYREVVLTGIHLSSYGVDLEGEDLLSLIKSVHAVEGIDRIRLGSLEPRIITEAFASELAKLSKICPHFHLSLQSGCDDTLKRMNRRYSAQEYYGKCELLRKYFENPALTTDLITGFPGETQEEFEESYAFVDKVDFYETHIFKYSRRRGTKAADMAEQVPEQVKAERSGRMLELNREKQRRYETAWLGKTVEVLFEETICRDGKKYQVGHTKEYLKVAVPAEESWENQLKEVKIVNLSQIIH